MRVERHDRYDWVRIQHLNIHVICTRNRFLILRLFSVRFLLRSPAATDPVNCFGWDKYFVSYRYRNCFTTDTAVGVVSRYRLDSRCIAFRLLLVDTLVIQVEQSVHSVCQTITRELSNRQLKYFVYWLTRQYLGQVRGQASKFKVTRENKTRFEMTDFGCKADRGRILKIINNKPKNFLFESLPRCYWQLVGVVRRCVLEPIIKNSK